MAITPAKIGSNMGAFAGCGAVLDIPHSGERVLPIFVGRGAPMYDFARYPRREFAPAAFAAPDACLVYA